MICEKWKNAYDYLPDAIVVEGPKAGGHLGYKENQLNDENFSLEKVLPEVVAQADAFGKASDKKIPVIAAGGIYTGEDMYRMMSLGASGVQLGTRFVTTEECDADLRFKQAYLDAQAEDIEIIKSPVGMPGRAISGEFLREVEQGHTRAESLPISLHQNVRSGQNALLHHHRAVQCLSRQSEKGICLCRKQCLP